MRSVLCFVLVILLIITGGSSDEDIASQIEPEITFLEIVGTWEWVGTVNEQDG